MNGRMTTPISIINKTYTTDSEGFQTATDILIVQTKAYREGRHGSERWRNRASFTDATDLFTIRNPGVEITTGYYIECEGNTWDITSVENVKGRGMYLEILGRLVVPSGTT